MSYFAHPYLQGNAFQVIRSEENIKGWKDRKEKERKPRNVNQVESLSCLKKKWEKPKGVNDAAAESFPPSWHITVPHHHHHHHPLTMREKSLDLESTWYDVLLTFQVSQACDPGNTNCPDTDGVKKQKHFCPFKKKIVTFGVLSKSNIAGFILIQQSHESRVICNWRKWMEISGF